MPIIIGALLRRLNVHRRLEPKKVAALVVCSDELLRDTQGEAVIQNDLRRAVSDALDLAFLSASAATSAQPAGILNGVTVVTGGADVQGSIGALLADFDGDLRRAVFIARPEVFASISTNYPRIGLRNGFLMNAPALSSPFVPADRLILADGGLIALASSGIEVRASKSANIEMTPRQLVEPRLAGRTKSGFHGFDVSDKLHRVALRSFC